MNWKCEQGTCMDLKHGTCKNYPGISKVYQCTAICTRHMDLSWVSSYYAIVRFLILTQKLIFQNHYFTKKSFQSGF